VSEKNAPIPRHYSLVTLGAAYTIEFRSRQDIRQVEIGARGWINLISAKIKQLPGAVLLFPLTSNVPVKYPTIPICCVHLRTA